MQQKESLTASPTLTGAQLRAARALIDVTAQQLADETMVSLATIRRAEKQNGPVSMTAANAARLRHALEERGVLFLPEETEGPGVRLRLAPPPRFGG